MTHTLALAARILALWLLSGALIPWALWNGIERRKR